MTEAELTEYFGGMGILQHHLRGNSPVFSGTNVVIDFPENHHYRGNPYPCVYENVAAHFYGSIRIDELGRLFLSYDMGNDISGENPLSDKSRQLFPMFEYMKNILSQEVDRINQCSDLQKEP